MFNFAAKFINKENTMYNFDAVKVKNDLIQWIKDWFETNGKGCI